jgi:uncharacterized damage-inducible protein DinB
MLTETLKLLFGRDLGRLKAEIELYRQEENIWRIEKSIANSAGNLALHLIGNLNTYIGATIGQTGYVRNRELEFSVKNVPRTELIEKIEATAKVVEHSLSRLTDQDMEDEYPMPVFTDKTSTEYLLVHLTTHLAYHLGQINYHRRMIDA